MNCLSLPELVNDARKRHALFSLQSSHIQKVLLVLQGTMELLQRLPIKNGLPCLTCSQRNVASSNDRVERRFVLCCL